MHQATIYMVHVFSYKRRRKVAKASTMELLTSSWFVRCSAYLWSGLYMKLMTL